MCEIAHVCVCVCACACAGICGHVCACAFVCVRVRPRVRTHVCTLMYRLWSRTFLRGSSTGPSAKAAGSLRCSTASSTPSCNAVALRPCRRGTRRCRMGHTASHGIIPHRSSTTLCAAAAHPPGVRARARVSDRIGMHVRPSEGACRWRMPSLRKKRCSHRAVAHET